MIHSEAPMAVAEAMPPASLGNSSASQVEERSILRLPDKQMLHHRQAAAITR